MSGINQDPAFVSLVKYNAAAFAEIELDKNTISKLDNFVSKQLIPRLGELKTSEEIENLNKVLTNIKAIDKKITKDSGGKDRVLGEAIPQIENYLKGKIVKEIKRPQTAESKKVQEIQKNLQSAHGTLSSRQASSSNIIQKLESAVSSNKSLSDATVLSNLQSRLKNLDLTNQTEVKALILDIDMLSQTHKRIKSQLDGVKLALTTCLNKKGFMPSTNETKALASLKGGLEKIGFATSSGKEDMISRSAKNELVEWLSIADKENFSESFVKKKIETLEQKALTMRIRSLAPTDKMNKEEVKNGVSNIIDLINEANRYEKVFSSHIDQVRERMYSVADSKTEGRFTPLIRTYSNLNLETRKETLVAEEMDLFLQKMTTELLQKKASNLFKTVDNFRSELKEFSKASSDRALLTFDDHVKKNLIPRYTWFVKNVDHVKKPYSQEDDPSRNMGLGGCMEGSLERHKLLMQNPALQTELIPMGTSEKGRRVRAFIEKEKAVNPEKAVKKMFEWTGLEVVGVHKVSVSKKTTSREEVVERVFVEDEFGLQARQGLLMFNMDPESPAAQQKKIMDRRGVTSENPEGHVINVQYDTSKGIYRFIDDNLAATEFESEEVFQREFQEYLELFYPDFQQFTVWFLE